MKDSKATLIGVQMVYCEDGVQTEVWLDIDTVQAIAWTDGEVKEKQKGQGGGNKLPSSAGPNPCTEGHVMAGQDVCWWNGSQWVCGSA